VGGEAEAGEGGAGGGVGILGGEGAAEHPAVEGGRPPEVGGIDANGAELFGRDGRDGAVVEVSFHGSHLTGALEIVEHRRPDFAGRVLARGVVDRIG